MTRTLGAEVCAQGLEEFCSSEYNYCPDDATFEELVLLHYAKEFDEFKYRSAEIERLIDDEKWDELFPTDGTAAGN